MRLAIGVLLVLLLVPAAARAADDGPAEKLVTATKVWKTGKGADNPDSCYVALLAEYRELKGYSAIKWTSKIYSADDPSFKGAPIEGPINAPYDDVYTPLGQRLAAPKDKHWTEIGFSSQAGSGDCSELEARSKRITRDPIKVLYRSNRGTMRIYGTIDPVSAFARIIYGDGFPERDVDELPQDEITKLLSGLKVVAKGPKKTFTAPVLPDGSKQSYFDMEIPAKYFGRYDVSIKSPKRDVEVLPKKRLVRVKPGLEERTAWTSGYDCDVKPPGMKFVPDREYYTNGIRDPLSTRELNWSCRSRAGRIRLAGSELNGDGYDNGTDNHFRCYSSVIGYYDTGSPTPQWLESHTMRLLPGGALTPVEANTDNGLLFRWKGLFSSADRFTVSVSSPNCGFNLGDQLQGSGDRG